MTELMTLPDGSVFERLSAEVLHPWFALAGQAQAVNAELLAVESALEALQWEWAAAQEVSWAVSLLWEGCSRWNVEQALRWLQAAAVDIPRALCRWGRSVSWLSEHGDAARSALYQPLYDQEAQHRERLAQASERIATMIAWVSETWGVPVPALEEVG